MVFDSFQLHPPRPRVAAIGLSEEEIDSITHLCGEIRSRHLLSEYVYQYDWSETDVLLMGSLQSDDLVALDTHVMIVRPVYLQWDDFRSASSRSRHYATTKERNTERELTVPPSCPSPYKPLALELCRQMNRAQEPPLVIQTTRREGAALIETTSHKPVAMRLTIPGGRALPDDVSPATITLLLPEAANLASWFTAFLLDLNDSDPLRVPHAPPRLSQPSDWYTPEEQRMANRIAEIETEVECLNAERDQLQQSLTAEALSANKTIRRILWAIGNELVDAVSVVLTELGFAVKDMDAELTQEEPKREDLRLTLDGNTGWEAIVEVKGYTSGTKTNDSRQVREHRDRYIREENRLPDLTVWLCNPYRAMDPSARPAPGPNVEETAANVGAVFVQAADLYKQWALVASGKLDPKDVRESLANADPGLWVPPRPLRP